MNSVGAGLTREEPMIAVRTRERPAPGDVLGLRGFDVERVIYRSNLLTALRVINLNAMQPG